MASSVILWSYALAALLFGMMALAQARHPVAGLPKWSFAAALGSTALCALAVAGIDAGDVTARVAESGRNLAWLVFMFALLRRDGTGAQSRGVTFLYGVTVLILLAGAGLAIAEVSIDAMADGTAFASVQILLHMMVAASALLLVQHLHGAVSPRTRGRIRLLATALAALWSVDLGLYATGYVTGQGNAEVIAIRGVAMVLIAPLFWVSVHRPAAGALRLSRTAAWQSISLAAIALYLVAMVLATTLIDAVGGSHARIAQTAFVFGSTAAMLTLVSSPWLKAWAKVKLAKHLFRHRYDYRAEWVRFTDTLGNPGDAAPLDERIVKAVADLTDSPAGLLLVPDGAGLGIGAGWNWSRDGLPAVAGESALAALLAEGDRIVELDAVRGGTAESAEIERVPHWMLDLPSAWALVPLVHLDRGQGAILLARPPVDRALDWEDFDLLRIAGRQVASYLAEARAQEALSDAQRFDEFNRRFAFILHDIKNLVSQLSLVARNAERHAENPAFRADMVATLQDSAGRMNDLLARLSQHHSARAEDCRAIDIVPLVERVAARRRAQHQVIVEARPAFAFADPVRLEQILAHLLQNAIEASDPAEPVRIAVTTGGDGVAIDIIDHGSGMSPAFVRDKLFKPFVSSKPGGFGIGAFEARQLAEAMGGSVSVASREGGGTRFRIVLPAARSLSLDHAA